MSTVTVSPLRQRMIEDMNARKLCAGTQRGHIHSCKRFAAFLTRSPDTATAEDIRRFLSCLFRGLFLAKLVAAHRAGRLKFFGVHARLDNIRVFKAYLAPLREIDWVVYAKRPFGGPGAVLAYLSRYTHRVASPIAA